MGTDMMRLLVYLVLGVTLGTTAHADTPSPLEGLLAPDTAGVVFHAAPGSQPANQRLRALDEAGRPLCCLRVEVETMPQPSDLRSGDSPRGARYGVTVEGALARLVAEGPVLAPVLRSGVKVTRVGSEHTRLKKDGQRWLLDKCLTQEGLRLTISPVGQADKAVLYFPLGYDVEPTCR